MNNTNKDFSTWSKVKKGLRWLPAIVWMGVIFYSSSQTGDEVGELLPIVQSIFPFIKSFNFMHIITYFVLAMTFDFAFASKARTFKYKILIVMLCLVYGVTDEYHQMFVGGRTPDLVDIRNDGIGAMIWVLLVMINPIKRFWYKLSKE